MAKKRKTVVKKIPALRKNVSSNALKTKTKIASMQEKIQVLNKDINATEDEKINEMINVSAFQKKLQSTITDMKRRSLVSQSKV